MITSINKKELIKKLLKNPRIAKLVKRFELTGKQLEDALPILIDMNTEDENSEYLTSFYVSETGQVLKSQVLSKVGQENLYKERIKTLKLEKLNFDNDNLTKQLPKTKEIAKLLSCFNKIIESLKKQNNSKGLYIYGPSNVGKTFFSMKFIRLIAKKGIDCGMVNLPNLQILIKSTFRSEEKTISSKTIFDILKDLPVLVIDDIGGETIAPWFRDEFLQRLLDHRHINKSLTIFNSLYSIEQLEKIESRSTNSKFNEPIKGKRIIQKIKSLSVPVFLKDKLEI